MLPSENYKQMPFWLSTLPWVHGVLDSIYDLFAMIVWQWWKWNRTEWYTLHFVFNKIIRMTGNLSLSFLIIGSVSFTHRVQCS